MLTVEASVMGTPKKGPLVCGSSTWGMEGKRRLLYSLVLRTFRVVSGTLGNIQSLAELLVHVWHGTAAGT